MNVCCSIVGTEVSSTDSEPAPRRDRGEGRAFKKMTNNARDDEQRQGETPKGDEIATDTDFNTDQEIMLQDKVVCDSHSPA